MFFSTSIMTFALPYGAFIAAAAALYFLFRSKHTGPKLKYLATTATITSVTTREPGPVPAPPVTAAAPDETGPDPVTPDSTGEADEPESEK
jgi:hypothetical protein